MNARLLFVSTVAVSLFAASSFAAPPTTKPTAPTTAPAAAPAADPFATLGRAKEAFRANDFRAAADLANQAQRDAFRQRIKPTDRTVIDAAHLEGVSLMKLGILPKATEALQKTFPAMPGDRTLLFNVALCDVMQRSLAVRATKNLQTYALAHSDDELIVNLLGCAIDVVATEGKNPGKLNEMTAAYAKIDAMLQATRPGMVRWGTQWMTQEDFAPIAAKRSYQKQRVDDAQRWRDRAVSALKSADSALARASAPITGIGIRPKHEYYNDRCQICLERERRYKMESAQRVVDECRPTAQEAITKYEQELAELPKPTWVMPMTPLNPFE